VLEENPAGLPAQAGKDFSSEAVRESLRQLYRSGRFADIRAETSGTAGGVRLDFVVRQNFYVNNVRISGLAEPPNEGTALAALRLGLGEIFRDSLLREALARLEQALREGGLYQARLEYELHFQKPTRQVDIHVRVTPGRRARIGGLALREESGATNGELLRRSKLKAGKEITAGRLERGAERIRKHLTKRGHLGARVTIRRGPFDPKSNTLPLDIEVFTGLKVRVEVTGAKISEARLKKLLPIYQEGAVDADLLQEGRRSIRDYLESQGYFDSQVRYTTGEDAKTGHQVITYTVERGPRRRLVGVAFEGNKYFDDELLRGRLRMQAATFLSRGRFSTKLLEADTESIRELYVANGFRSVQVRGDLAGDYQGKKGDLFVSLRIEEGPQTLVATLKLEGNTTLSEDFLLSNIGSTPGQPYSDFNVASDRDNILALYYNEGFPEARFEPEAAELDGEGGANRVRLSYRIIEGPQYQVKRVLVGGQEHTREDVIAREIEMRPGEPLRQGEIVETQRRLYNLGIFSRAQIAPQNPSGTDTEKTVIVQVEEAKRYTIAYGGGVEVQRLGSASNPVSGEVRASPRGIFEFTKANMLGRAHTLSFKGRASALQGRLLVSYATPSFLNRPQFNFVLTGFADKTRDVRTFTSTRYEASAQVAHQVSNISTVLYRYVFRRVQVDAGSLKVDPSEIPLFSQPTKISLLGTSWIREKRDNPADAWRGDFNTADFSVASKPLGSSASFLRVFFQNSTFHPIRGRVAFARSMRIGIQRALGSTTPKDIPLPERFFAGGGNSLRGFGLNQAGPRDPVTGFPVGGEMMLLFNQELRFPMRLPFVRGQLGGSLFYDAGNVFRQANKMSFRASPTVQDVTSGDLSYLSHTIGLGFRYATPIGPVRLDLGFLLNPATIEFCKTSSAPTALRCPAGQAVQRSHLPRFHFFFNIGSLF